MKIASMTCTHIIKKCLTFPNNQDLPEGECSLHFPVSISSFTVLIYNIRNGNAIEFIQFYRLQFSSMAHTDNRDLLMVEEEMQHTEAQKSF